MGLPAYTNRLIHETSPYLLQHAHNPVDWHAWGPEALGEAVERQKPILLSIGYAACHWCHVMERESFEDEETARLMNDLFVCIKVDREERPDLDDIYMQATVAMNGHGGWPMTVFLTPDQRPFFAGTYFPPRDAHGRLGFPTLLRRIGELWQRERDGLIQQAEELTQAIVEQTASTAPATLPRHLTREAVRSMAAQYDATHGGFGSAPKFPPGPALRLLLRHHAMGGDSVALEMVCGTLDGMHRGGIYDHLAGGFARYSTDARWLVPHFEKMLYDNGQLARVYLEAHQVTGEARYRQVAVETLDYALREMQDADGGFYSATDADSEGEEGKYYVFTPEDVHAVLDGDDAAWFCRYYDVTEQGNWEGKSVLHIPRSLPLVARSLDVDEQVLRQSLDGSRRALLHARQQRIPPLLDDKILVSWNALMISALAEAARVLLERRYRDAAERAARYILDHMRHEDGSLYRTARRGRAHLDAYLEDYAFLSDALIDLYEAGASSEYLEAAARLAERLLTDFRDTESGAFFMTAHGHEQLIARPRDGQDDSLPNANAVAARTLARLSYHLDRPQWRDHAAAALQAFGGLVQRVPRAFATALEAAQWLSASPIELALIGSPADPEYQRLQRAVAGTFLPQRIIAHGDPASGLTQAAGELPPLLHGKGLVGGRPALYICRDFSCAEPVTSAEEVAPALRQALDALGSQPDS